MEIERTGGDEQAAFHVRAGADGIDSGAEWP
jgi:hypothetical protein